MRPSPGSSARAVVRGRALPGASCCYQLPANPNGGTVNQANLDGSNPHALFANQGAPYGVAVGP